jgi:hypothetical protein
MLLTSAKSRVTRGSSVERAISRSHSIAASSVSSSLSIPSAIRQILPCASK